MDVEHISVGGIVYDVVDAAGRSRQATEDTLGSVILTESSAITATQGIALSGREKNPEIQDSLMYHINQNKSEIDDAKYLQKEIVNGAITLFPGNWIRFAELVSAHDWVKAFRGSDANGCSIIIKRFYYASGSEYHHIGLALALNLCKFVSIAEASASKLITKIRYVKVESEGRAYTDIYYAGEAAQNAKVQIMSGLGYGNYSAWQIIDSYSVPEVTTGETVLAVFDLS